jgi:mRNA-degrading endonuclease RelE of RelBE toxin-antitoxin system
VKSHINAEFRKTFDALPTNIQQAARSAYRRFRENPQHPGLQFKRVVDDTPIYSVRIGLHYRALGVLQGDDITWFWIGPHSEYDRRI